MEYTEWTITDCIKKVNETLFLPDIQRPYVWKEDDIYLLYDSICRDYPINTVLFWLLEKDTLENASYIKRIKFITQRFNETTIDTSPISRDNYYLAIDGQQRITSFYLTLKGTYKIGPKKNLVSADLYFNFLSGVEENEKEMMFEFQFFPHDKPDVWIEKITDKKKVKNPYDKNWIRLKYIVSLDKLHEVQSKIKGKVKKDINYDIKDEENNFIFKLWSKLHHEKLITFYEEKTQEYDKVLDIFIRTNSGGEKLSYSDLLFSYIKLKWYDARDKFNKLVKLLNDNDRYTFTNDVLLKTLLFFHSKDQDGLKYRTANFSDDMMNLIKSEWDTIIVNTLKVTQDLISSRFLLTNEKLITSYNALIPIAYFIYKYKITNIGEDKNNITSTLQSQMRDWLLTSMLTGVFGGQSDGILYRAKKAIDESSKVDYFPTKELFEKFNEAKPALTLKVTEDLINDVSYNSKESYLVLSLLYNHSINFMPRSDKNYPEQDHIVCKHELKTAKIPEEKINSIYNIRYVTMADNRTKSDEPFNDWAKRLGDQVLDNHFIPHGKWDASNFDKFLEERKALFLKQIGI